MQLTHAITTASPSPLAHLVRSGVGEHAAVALQVGGIGRDAGTIRSYHRDQEIFAEGDPADLFFEVITGTVRTYRLLLDGRRQIDAFHLKGDIFGLEGGSEHRFCAEATGDVTLRVLRRRSKAEISDQEISVSARPTCNSPCLAPW